MQRLALAVSMLAGWRRFLVAFAAGALSMLAMAPLHFWPAMLATLPVFVWLLDGCYAGNEGTWRPSRSSFIAAAWTGWAFGFGYFLTGLYWIGFAFLVEAEIFAWLLPFAVTLMPAGLALFFALAAVLAGLLWRPGPARLVGLAIALTATEWLRGKVLTGFPWNTLGYAVAGPEAMMQWSSLFGVYALTLFAVLILSAPAAIWAPPAMSVPGRLRRFGYPAAMALAMLAAFLWGHWRLLHAETQFVDGVSLRIVQPAIPQKEKWKPENRAAVFQRYLQVSRKGGPEAEIVGVTHLIWPESALPFLLDETQEALNAVARMLPDGSVLITGQARADRSSGRTDIFNSLFVMDDEANVLARYDKVHLVPFGEYLPLQPLLEAVGLQQLTRIRGGFAFGDNPRLTSAPGVPPFVALICYEIIFPDAIREQGPKPGWMLNVTNDAWFGDTAGPHQHFHQARVRAVEQGLPLVRAANTGITAVIDPYGRIIARLPRETAAVLDAGLPAAIPGTVFVRHGRTLLVLLVLGALAFWYLLSRRTAAKER